jgi:hypothetical protein
MSYNAEIIDEVWSTTQGRAYHLASMAKEQHDQLQEALSIIKDLALLHDSYIGYLLAHNMYNEDGAKMIGERINVLSLKQ